MRPAGYKGYKHGDTPKKAMVRGTISYLESQGLPVNKSAIFRHFDLSRSQGYAALSSPASSKRSDPEWEETRGRPSKVSEADQRRMEMLLWEEESPQQQQQQQNQQHDLEHQHHGEGGKMDSGSSVDGSESGGFNWTRLAKAAGVEVTVNPRTLHRAMGTLGYRRCLSCGRSVVHRRCREKRADWARRVLEAYPTTEDWRRVRFSIELHFGFGLDGRVRLLPRPGERLHCPGCEAGDDAGLGSEAGWPRDIRKVHAWAAAGYGFKSKLVFYEDSTSPNCAGTPSMADYHYKILDKEVRSWLAADPAFVLYEDVEAFAHGGLSKQNAVQSWKESAGLRHVFGCGDAPDLNPLETLWPARKQWQFGEVTKGDGGGEEDGKGQDWEDETLRGMARRAWDGVEQERVNIWVDFMVQRLRQVVESEGRLVPW
ncbi:hypothetical protein JDV02_003434 [Purpureocillium takamizusanense]|uniref:HMG box protein n=1 Tax=Purpureocillium takamizusanense TaxID=2060973 RepID=A0A9Q8QDN6_9HYPO|nr:uncharacterized protein JDV02_003434 [Purpureocillium takamizusanense]UNI17054.1 hypothetical protein JDV02_003434 [Purpureocillium takamizusanense]